jgi:lantibiotic biosynthesis protein
MHRGPWLPLLEGDLARLAREAVDEIAADLQKAGDGDASLAEGRAGQALFFAYLGRFSGEEGYLGVSERLLDEATDALVEVPMHAGLYSGFPGIAWTEQHLAGFLGFKDDPGDDAGREIDEAVLDVLSQTPWPESVDLIRGLAGIGVYAIERLPRSAARACLERILAHLADLAERDSNGAKWFTPPNLLGPWALSFAPNGRYDLGVAHGAPGVISLLAEVHRLGLLDARGISLLEEAVRWLLARMDEQSGGPGCFNSWVAPGGVETPARLAWCYGDPGIAAAVLNAARALGRPDWEAAGLEIAIRAATRPLESSGIRDAGLCHGALGLAHLFNRIHQATRDDRFAEAARLWYGLGLHSFRRPGEGVGGFPVSRREPDGTYTWQEKGGLLVGSAGVGLALLAGLSDQEPLWDRLLLTAIPPASLLTL